jgi:serine protease Do
MPSDAKGCYIFQNFLGVELYATFTAQDWQFADEFTIPAMTDTLRCFDPGRYTYTFDAPPPWSDIDGELIVEAGDFYLFPIRGEP